MNQTQKFTTYWILDNIVFIDELLKTGIKLLENVLELYLEI